jgi:hypothetical protein
MLQKPVTLLTHGKRRDSSGKSIETCGDTGLKNNGPYPIRITLFCHSECVKFITDFL